MTICLFAALIIGMITVPAFADIPPSLYKQLETGIPINMIECSDNKTLTSSPNSRTACVYDSTAKKLESRGWVIVLQETVSMTENTTDVPSDDEIFVEFARGESTSHKSMRSFPYDPITTFSMPSTVNVGETFTIHYTYTWLEPDPDTGELKEIIEPYYDTGDQDRFSYLRFFLPDEFSLVSDITDLNWHYYLADLYDDHALIVYLVKVPYDTSQHHSGSIDFRLDKAMLHDTDLLFLNRAFYSDNNPDGFIIVKNSNGVEFVSEKIMKRDFKIGWGEPFRYLVPHLTQDDYVPSVRPVPKEYSIDKEPDYVPREKNGRWDTFAAFTRAEIDRINPQNVTEWLLDLNLNLDLVNNFLAEYPELNAKYR